MYKILVIFFLFYCSQANAQADGKALDLNRFFYDWTPTFGMLKPVKSKTPNTMGGITLPQNPPEFGGGLEFKAGNNWYLRKGKFCGLIQLTWLRLGFFFSDGLLSFASPANIGIGHHFQLNNEISITPILQSGILFVLDDPLYFEGYIDYFLMAEVKLNIRNFSLGLEYTRRRNFNSFFDSVIGYYHYVGLSFGRRLGSL